MRLFLSVNMLLELFRRKWALTPFHFDIKIVNCGFEDSNIGDAKSTQSNGNHIHAEHCTLKIER